MFRTFVITICIVFVVMLAKIAIFGPAKDRDAARFSEENVVAADRSIVAEAEPEPVKVTASKQKKVMRVAFNTNPPRKYVEHDRAEGPAAEILRAFATRYDIDLDFSFCELNECLERLKTGNADVSLEIAKLPEREAFIEYLDPSMMLSAAKVFYQRKNDARVITSNEDFAALKLGYLKDNSYFNDFDKNKSLKKTAFNTVDAMLQALLSGKIDAFIGMEDRTDFVLSKKDGAAALKKSALQVRENILVNFLAMAKQSSFLSDREKIEQLLGNMYLDGTVNAVVTASMSKFRIASAK